jgi:transcriptional regulator with XRE-family HTH domain
MPAGPAYLRDFRTAFGKALQQARRKAGWSQEELAVTAGVTRTFVSLIEIGKSQPTIETIARLAHALRCKPSDLILTAEATLRRRGRPLQSN